MENELTFKQGSTLESFMENKGFKAIDIITNPKTGKKFFSFDGGALTGLISKKVKKLAPSLIVSEVEGTTEEGDDFEGYMLHTTNRSNIVDTFTLE